MQPLKWLFTLKRKLFGLCKLILLMLRKTVMAQSEVSFQKQRVSRNGNIITRGWAVGEEHVLFMGFLAALFYNFKRALR